MTLKTVKPRNALHINYTIVDLEGLSSSSRIIISIVFLHSFKKLGKM